MKKYQLTMTKNYVTNWTVQDAIRELLQNALDNPDYAVERIGEELHITSYDVTLDPSDLLLGATSKNDGGSTIGHYGEGFKIAILVLTREGYPVSVKTGNTLWEADFEFSDDYCTDVLTITEYPTDEYKTETAFIVGNFGKEEMFDLKARFLPLDPDKKIKYKHTPYGTVLYSKPGDIYVRGLWVCNLPDFKFGYNFRNLALTTGRDRVAASAFDIRWEAGCLLNHTDGPELAEALIEESADVLYLRQAPISKLPLPITTELVYKHLQDTYGDRFVVCGQPNRLHELERKYEPLTPVVQVALSVETMLRSYLPYVEMVDHLATNSFRIPAGLQDWFEEYSDQITEEAYRSLFEILGGSENE